MKIPPRFLRAVLPLVFSAWALAAAAAPEPSARLPEMVVTARTEPESTAHFPASSAVWRPDEDAWGLSGGLPDLAAETPGVTRSGDGPWTGDLSIRGFSGDRIVVTVDGARLVTANDLAARLALIDPMAVERVEVFKGPVSSLYGSGSLGGLVNVVLRQPDYPAAPELRQRLRLGALVNPDGWTAHYGATHAGPSDYLSAAATARDAAAYRDGDGDRVRNTQFADQALTLRAGHRWREGADSDLLVQWHEGDDIGLPGSGSAPLPPRADVTYETARRALVALNHRVALAGRHWKSSRLQAYFQRIERRVRIDGFPDGPLLRINPAGRHDTAGTRWLNAIALGDHQVGAGLETWRRELESTRTRAFADGRRLKDQPLPRASEWSYGAFVEDRWAVAPGLSLTSGLRADGLRVENRATPQWAADEVDDWNGNAHAGLRVQATETLALRGVVAAGYRAPSLEERYQYLVLGDGRVKLGRPDLEAEKSRFAEVGAEWTEGDWSAEVSGFVNALRNRVGEEQVDEQTLRNAGIDRARIHGLELEIRRELTETLSVQAALAWLRGDDRSAGTPLPDIAPLTGSAGLGWRPAPAWRARVRTCFAARQDRVPEGAVETPGWARTDAAVGYLIEGARTTHEIRLEVLNLGDATWRDHLSTWRGAPHFEPGRSFQLAWDARF